MMPDMAPWLILQKVGEFVTYETQGTNTSQNVIQDVAQIAKDIDKNDASKGSTKETTIVHEVLRSDIPSYEKRPERLGQEALGLLIGGTETNASSKLPTVHSLTSKLTLSASISKLYLPPAPESGDASDLAERATRTSRHQQ